MRCVLLALAVLLMPISASAETVRLYAAGSLKAAFGYHATGVDRLMEEAGIAKTTLYRHFGSKEELIVAALAKVDEDTRDGLRTFVEAASDDPCARILATFDQLAIWLADREFKGCPLWRPQANSARRTIRSSSRRACTSG